MAGVAWGVGTGNGEQGTGKDQGRSVNRRLPVLPPFPVPRSLFPRRFPLPTPHSLLPILLTLTLTLALSACGTGRAASAEEYFAIGMAYFDLGKYADAEKWLNRAAAVNKTRNAGEYNLGRIAFETGRYEDAAKHFERILAKDPENVMALKAAAYSRIKTGDLSKAAEYYGRVLALVPESADDGYNYALVLYAMEDYAKLDEVLARYPFALEENKDVLLLLARAQKAQGKVEAIDTYAKWLASNSDPKAQYEYAQVLEGQELYAKALEQYRGAYGSLPETSEDPKKSDLRYTIARLLLIADNANEEGPKELLAAVDEGYADTDALKELLSDTRLSEAGKQGVQAALDKIAAKAAGTEAPPAEASGEEAPPPEAPPEEPAPEGQ